MTDQPTPLSPDDTPETPLDLNGKNNHTGQPYGLISLLAGMTMMFLCLLILPNALASDHLRLVPLISFDAGVVMTIIAYLVLITARPKVHLLAACILAAELGMLYGMPTAILSYTTWQSPEVIAGMLSWFVFAGVSGILIGRGFEVEHRAAAVIPISFLFTFVVVSLMQIFGLPVISLPR